MSIRCESWLFCVQAHQQAPDKTTQKAVRKIVRKVMRESFSPASLSECRRKVAGLFEAKHSSQQALMQQHHAAAPCSATSDTEVVQQGLPASCCSLAQDEDAAEGAGNC